VDAYDTDVSGIVCQAGSTCDIQCKNQNDDCSYTCEAGATCTCTPTAGNGSTCTCTGDGC
jgi:hypothetical protein